jgi:hypothetical protein
VQLVQFSVGHHVQNVVQVQRFLHHRHIVGLLTGDEVHPIAGGERASTISSLLIEPALQGVSPRQAGVCGAGRVRGLEVGDDLLLKVPLREVKDHHGLILHLEINHVEQHALPGAQ